MLQFGISTPTFCHSTQSKGSKKIKSAMSNTQRHPGKTIAFVKLCDSVCSYNHQSCFSVALGRYCKHPFFLELSWISKPIYGYWNLWTLVTHFQLKCGLNAGKGQTTGAGGYGTVVDRRSTAGNYSPVLWQGEPRNARSDRSAAHCTLRFQREQCFRFYTTRFLV